MVKSSWVQAMSLQFLLAALVTSSAYPNPAPQQIAEPQYRTLPPLREQAVIEDAWTEERISKVPSLLQKYDVDAWLISQREYAEETVFWSLKSATQFSARRRTLMLFLANASAGTPPSYSWIDNTPSIWTDLLEVLDTQKPSNIAVNVDADISFSGGMHAGELDMIVNQIGPQWAKKLVNRPMLAVEFIATMVPAKLPWYRKLQETSWAIISEAFSEKVIEPGVTTAEDVAWWYREKTQSLNYSTWFQPTVEIILPTTSEPGAPSTSDVIQYGDLLHVDFGVTALGLNTDIQHLAYVLYPGQTEEDIPQGLLDGLKKANRLQDILKENMEIGKSGNEILKVSLKQMRSEEIEGEIYSHPIGDWGHSAGTLIGMTNLQSGVPVLGDLPLLSDTYYSVELYAEHFVPELNKTLNFYLEEDIAWMSDQKRWDWVYARQEKYHLIKTAKGKGEAEGPEFAKDKHVNEKAAGFKLQTWSG